MRDAVRVDQVDGRCMYPAFLVFTNVFLDAYLRIRGIFLDWSKLCSGFPGYSYELNAKLGIQVRFDHC